MLSIARSTAGRTINVKVQPRPRSVADTRKVLEVLRQYGEVEMFKHLKYEPVNPNPVAFIAIYKTASSASEATWMNDINFEYDKNTPAKMFIVDAKWKNEEYIARQPYTNAYPRAPRTAMYADMRGRLPVGLEPLASLDYKALETPIKNRLEVKEYKRRAEIMGRSGWMELWEQAQRSSERQDIVQELGETDTGAKVSVQEGQLGQNLVQEVEQEFTETAIETEKPAEERRLQQELVQEPDKTESQAKKPVEDG